MSLGGNHIFNIYLTMLQLGLGLTRASVSSQRCLSFLFVITIRPTNLQVSISLITEPLLHIGLGLQNEFP